MTTAGGYLARPAVTGFPGSALRAARGMTNAEKLLNPVPYKSCHGQKHRDGARRCNWGALLGSSALHSAIDMCATCTYVMHMTTMIQIRNVPDALHRRLKSRAALAGMSLSDYLLSEIRQVGARPTLDELRARLEQRPSVTLTVEPVTAIRAERDRNDRR